MNATLTWFRRQLRAAGDAATAASQRAYMKSELRFYGVTAPTLRTLCKQHAGTIETHAQLRAAVDAMFASDEFDLHSAAIGLLERHLALLGRDDAEWLVSLVRIAGCWAHVDWLATKIVPATLPPKPARLLKAWARDDDFWVRRTALLAQHDALRAGGGDFALFAMLAAPMLQEREFFIRKAIGWVLREVSKRRPELTAEFVRRHRDAMAGLTLREAVKRLPPELRQQLLPPS